MDIGSLLFSLPALIVSVISFYFSVKSWRESNRPIVTVRVTAANGGEEGTPLNLVVENTGSRPAKNIRLTVDNEELEELLAEQVDEIWRKHITRCFSERAIIPILGNGKSVSNTFGWLSGNSKSAWRGEVRFNVQISYKDLDGRKYEHTNPLLVADDTGFAGGFWDSKKKA
ncbi:MAG TPA: hypothetical protein VGC66_05680 [Pyrinomonadaceae bacterium]|jgi:hypothetical protein